MAFSIEASNRMLQVLFGSTTPATKPTSWWLGLSAFSVGGITRDVDGLLTGIIEPTGGGYGRVEIPNNNTNWDVSDDRAINILNVDFPEGTDVLTGEPFITDWVLWTAETGGAAMYSGNIVGSVNWAAGNTVRMPAYSIEIALSD